MKGVREALAIATVERYIALAANFTTLAIISRILTPTEVGVSVLGTGIMLFSQSIREFSSSVYLIQRRELTQNDSRGFVTLQLLAAIIIFASIIASTPVVEDLYRGPGLAPYLRVVAFCILFEAVSAPIIALMRREMAISTLAVVNTCGVFVYVGLTISLAVLGYSFMSVAWAQLGSAIVIALLAALLHGDLSIFKPRIHNWREIALFGTYNGTNIFLYRIYELVPLLVLGRMASVEAVALFNRGVSVCQLPNKVILEGASSVLLPAFSAAVRSGTDLREPYLRSLSYIAVLQWPAYLLLAILAHPVVDFILGHRWIAVAPLVQIMALASLFSISSDLNYPALVAAGGMRKVFFRALIVWPISALMAIGAAYYGLHTAAVAWLMIIPFQAYVSTEFVRNYISIGWGEIAQTVKNAAMVSLCTILGPLLIVIGEGTFAIPTSAAVIACLLAALSWGAAVWYVGHPLLEDARKALIALSQPFRRDTANKPNALPMPQAIQIERAHPSSAFTDPKCD